MAKCDTKSFNNFTKCDMCYKMIQNLLQSETGVTKLTIIGERDVTTEMFKTRSENFFRPFQN